MLNFFCILWTRAPIPSLFICKLMCPTGGEEQQTLPILKIRLWHGNRVAERHCHEFSSRCVQGRAYASYTCTSGWLPGMESSVRAHFPRRASTEAGVLWGAFTAPSAILAPCLLQCQVSSSRKAAGHCLEQRGEVFHSCFALFKIILNVPGVVGIICITICWGFSSWNLQKAGEQGQI